MEQRTIAVVVITHNRKQKVLRCLASIIASTRVPDEIIVIDNASDDGTAEAVMQSFPSIHLVCSPSNLLPARAANIGLRMTNADYVLVMADDNSIDSDMIRALEAGIEEMGAGIAGAKMYYASDPERIWTTGARLNLATGLCRFPGAGQLDHGQWDAPWEPDSVHNALFIARWVVVRIGVFDEKCFPIQNEEADYCIRARRAGVKIIIIPQAKLWHDAPLQGGGPKVGSRDFAVETPIRAYYSARNRILLIRKHSSRRQKIEFFGAFLPMTLILYSAVILTRRDRWSRMAAYLKGIVDGIRFDLH